MDPTLQLVIQLLIVIVIGAVGLIVKNLSGDIKEFTKNLTAVATKITDLEVEMIKNFVLKEELIPIKNRVAELLSREDMAALRAQVKQIAEDVTTLMARAEMTRRKGEA